MEKLDINLMLNRSQEMEKIKKILKGIEVNIVRIMSP